MIYNDKYLTFPDKATQETFYNPDEEINLFPQLHWDVIGTIYDPPETEEDPPIPKDGWNVNVCYRWDAEWPTELNNYIITPPVTPYRIRPVPELTQERRKTLKCTRLQADLMLRYMGILDTVETWVATAPEEVQAAYNKAYEFSRDSALWEGVKAGFGWSDLDLDRMFVRAASIKV